MSLPTLTQFLDYPPGWPMTTSLGEVMVALGQDVATPCSHIIIVDEHQRPIGALSVKQIWSYAATGNLQGTLAKLREELEPIIQVEGSQSLAVVWPLPSPETAPPVVVDELTRYIGIVDPLAVLRWLAGEISLNQLAPAPSPTQDAAETGQASKDWLLEVSHALKNPLTSLLGLSTLLLDPRLGTLNHRQNRYATLIRQVVRRLIALINQLLDWMRLEAGQLTFDIQTVPLQPFVGQVFENYLAQLSPSQTEATWSQHFALDFPPQPYALQVDPMRLQLSLHWLLDYLLHCQAEPAGLECSPWGPWMGLTLWTMAPPLDLSQTLPELSQPVVSSASISQEGSLGSLGVLLARRFCQAQGGDLTYWISAAGNRLTLLLPMDPKRPEQPASKAMPTPTVLVLLVSRQPEVIDRVYDHLQGSDYRLAVARSVAEAEGMIQRLNPPFVLVCQSFSSEEISTLRQAIRPPTMDILSIVLELVMEPEAVASGAKPGEGQVRVAALRSTLDRLRVASLATPTQPSALGLTLLLLPLPQPDLPGDDYPQLTAEVRSWLQHYHCRLLQVDNLAQARILSRVWQPDVILIDPCLPAADPYWQDLAQYPELVRLPLIALTSDSSLPGPLHHGLRLHSCFLLSHLSPQQMAIDLIQTIATVLDW
jgi:hypothetical protein